MAREHDDGCLIVDVLQYFADRRVDRDVDILDRIADHARLRRVVPRVSRVVQVPALVSDTVGLAEDLAEEIPFTALEKVPSEPSLDADSIEQLLAEGDE